MMLQSYFKTNKIMPKNLLMFLMLTFFVDVNAQHKSGCISGTCTNGKGTYAYPNGSRYSGDFRASLPYGKGSLLSRDGSIYHGDYVKGLKHGKGKMTYTNGDTYFGEFKNDIIAGQGKMNYRNKDSYYGSWHDGQSHGHGAYVFADGEQYIGEFVAGQFNGNGKLIRTDGSSYEGQWVQNKKHGEGIATDRKGTQMFQVFNMNKLIKESKTSTNNNTQTEQANAPTKDCTDQYCDGVRGKFMYGDGSVYVGDFVKGDAQGEGICYYVNGDKYVGGWKNHGPNGNGTMYFAGGNVFSALWEQGVPKEKLQNSVEESPKPSTTIVKDEPKYLDTKETKVYALVVGIASYNHMQSLKYTDDDAYQLYAFFKSPEGGAIADPDIKILIDDAATKNSIITNLKLLADKADANDVVILYMSGHGLEGSFVPSDFNGYENHLSYEDILAILDNSQAKHKLFLADACHSGSMAVASKSPFSISLQNFYNAYNTARGGTAVLMSSKREEVSLEYGGLRQGVFSHFLIKGLKGEADIDGNKIVNINELSTYVNTHVKQYTNNAQNPQIIGDYDRNMPVAMIR
jgi:hypothetical protein